MTIQTYRAYNSPVVIQLFQGKSNCSWSEVEVTVHIYQVVRSPYHCSVKVAVESEVELGPSLEVLSPSSCGLFLLETEILQKLRPE